MTKQDVLHLISTYDDKQLIKLWELSKIGWFIKYDMFSDIWSSDREKTDAFKRLLDSLKLPD